MKKVLKKFGKYLLLDRLAQGGMAEIFRAWAPSVDGGGRLIVLKCVQPNYGEDPDFLQMFRSEIRVTMGLNHPNIVQLYDFGETDGHPYIAMELVDGKNLKQFIARVQQKKQIMAPEYAAFLISQAAAGLHYAHSYKDRTTGKPLQIIHRDVSPQNLLIAYQGNLKIIDFGIAKAASNSQETRAGIIKGKPSYLSPEQIEGTELDGRSDVFSLGAVLWETLAGRKCFSGDSDLAAIRMIEECDTSVKPPSVINKAVPPELDAIALKALAKDRNQRFATAEEMQRALHRFVYAYKPDFDPSEFAKYFQQLFKAEIDEEQRTIQQLNIEAKDLFQQSQQPQQQPLAANTSYNTKTGTRKEAPKTFNPISLDSVEVDMASNPGFKLPQGRQTGRYSSGTVTHDEGHGSRGRGGGPGKLLVPVLLIGALVYFAPQLETFVKGLSQTSATSSAQNARLPRRQVVAHTPVALRFAINPSGGGRVQVLVNQKPVNPNAVEVLAGAPVNVTVLKTGFKPFQKIVKTTSSAGELTVEAFLEPLNYGTLTLQTTPTAEARISSGSMIWLTNTPLDNFKLPPGTYQIQLVNRLLGMKKDLSLRIQANRSVSEDVNLDVIK